MRSATPACGCAVSCRMPLRSRVRSRPLTPEAATALIEALEEEVSEEKGAKLGPPVGGSDVGFSVLSSSVPIGISGYSGDSEFEVGSTGAPGHADLPFVNLELDGDVIRYGFFKDEEAAQASDAESAGGFGETEAYAAGEEALGDDFEYVGAVDLAPILDQLVPDPSVTDAILGPAELIAPFLADKLGVVAFGIRYEDEAAIQRYVLTVGE